MGMIEVEKRGAILVLLLNRPERRNAIDHETAVAIEAALDDLDADTDLRAAIITGAGDYFSAGADLKAAAQGGKPAATQKRGNFGLIRKPLDKPLIAAVEGGALGGGFEIALACDLIMSARNAVFGLPEVSRGVMAAAGGCVSLPRKIPINVAKELALTGHALPATRLYELGLINTLCEPGKALAAATTMAEEIAGNAPLAVSASKRVIDMSEDMCLAESWAMQDAEAVQLRASEDYREGITAFAGKRTPVWKGR